MNIKEFKKIIFEKASNYGIEEFELFYQKNNSFKVSVYNGEIEKYQNNSSAGVSFRAIVDGKMGYAYSEKIDENSAEVLLKAVIENSKIINGEEKEFIYKGNEKYPNINLYNEEINDYDTEFKINLAKEIEKKALEYDERIKAVTTCFVGNVENEIYIANNKGVDLFEKANGVFAYISVTAEENNIKKTGGHFWQGKSFGPDNYNSIVKIAEISSRKALELLDSETINKGKMNVIFKNEAFADILTTFVSNFFAETVQKGFSMLKGKIGEKVASDSVTIKDLPLLETGFGSCNFDSEGVATYNKTIVENGVLKTFLYNLKSANKDGVKSTGNGFKVGFKGPITTSATNFLFEAGKIDFDTLVKDMKNGLIITSLAGLHSGTDSISGNFSLAGTGFLVENGEIIKPVEQITVSGNFYELLNNILNISNDLFFDMPSGAGAIICPSVLVENINVAS